MASSASEKPTKDGAKRRARKQEKSYHHGDLPSALRSATAELITEKGPTGFSLREVARRAGVSHSAPAHHFGDSKGLLTSVAAEGYRRLVKSFEDARDVPCPIDRLNMMGKAYIRTAYTHPGHFGVMSSHDLVNHDDPEYVGLTLRAFTILNETVSEIAEQHNPKLCVEAASIWVWATVRGLATIQLGAKSYDVTSDTNKVDQLVDQCTDLMVHGLFAATGE